MEVETGSWNWNFLSFEKVSFKFKIFHNFHILPENGKWKMENGKWRVKVEVEAKANGKAFF